MFHSSMTAAKTRSFPSPLLNVKSPCLQLRMAQAYPVCSGSPAPFLNLLPFGSPFQAPCKFPLVERLFRWRHPTGVGATLWMEVYGKPTGSRWKVWPRHWTRGASQTNLAARTEHKKTRRRKDDISSEVEPFWFTSWWYQQ